jgi:glyoxylase-like metal-dependent hydrolase (beta-lactamase superfamily II)
MHPVDEFQQIADSLIFWQGYDPLVKADLCSTELRVGSEWFLIDPIPLAKGPLAELAEIAPPSAIILTNGNHERCAKIFRKKFSVPVIAHEDARGEFLIEIDEWLAGDSAVIRDKFSAVHLRGAAKGEIALHAGRVLVVGDAIINLDQTGFAFLPDKYCENAKQLRESARRLIAFEFEIMTFAHGLPIVSGAKRRLENLLT